MTQFYSWRAFWNFRQSVSRQRRYVWTEEEKVFLQAAAETCGARAVSIPAGSIFWRAQQGNDWRSSDSFDPETLCPLPSDRMRPLRDRANEGRVNPKGIPCLYLASTKETAMSEVRPWMGSYVSVAQFQTMKDLRIVNCSKDDSEKNASYFQEGPPEVIEKAVWHHINCAFSDPASRSDELAEYAATQILAELFRSEGYDGVAYKSALRADGYNIALFDLDAAKQLNCFLFEASDVAYSFREAANPYYIKEK